MNFSNWWLAGILNAIRLIAIIIFFISAMAIMFVIAPASQEVGNMSDEQFRYYVEFFFEVSKIFLLSLIALQQAVKMGRDQERPNPQP